MSLAFATKRLSFNRPLLASGVVLVGIFCPGGHSQDRSSPGAAQAITKDTTNTYPAKAAPPAFFDEPQFVVAGVTDAMGSGGHGSDRVLRTTEALAREVGSLDRNSSPGGTPDLAKQEKVLREALRQDPDGGLQNYQLGDVLVQQGRSREALPYLQKAHAIKADYAVDYALALAYAGSGDWERARSSVQALLAVRDNASAHHLIAEANEKLGDPLAAEREYARACQLDPSESNLFDWGAELLAHRAVEPAIEVFNKGSQKYPHSARMLIGLGVAWDARGSYPEAARSLCRAADLDPQAVEAYVFLGRMERAEATVSDCSLERLKRFAALAPQNPLSSYYYAVSLWKSRKNDDEQETMTKVEMLLESALRLDPKLALAHMQLGILHAHRRDLAQAGVAYRKAIALDSGLEEAHYRLAQVYLKTGEAAKARAELQVSERLSKEVAKRDESERKSLQQFVYTLRGQAPEPGK